MTGRHLIVVDVETTSLADDATILEVAALDVHTGEEFRAVPFITQSALAKADPVSLSINRYYERQVFKDMLEDAEVEFARRMHGPEDDYYREHYADDYSSYDEYLFDQYLIQAEGEFDL